MALKNPLIRRQAILRLAWGVQRTWQQKWEPDPDTRYFLRRDCGPWAKCLRHNWWKRQGQWTARVGYAPNQQCQQGSSGSQSNTCFPSNCRVLIEWETVTRTKNSWPSASLGLQSNVLYWTILMFDVAANWTILTAEGTQPKPKKAAALGADQELTTDSWLSLFRVLLRPAPWMAARAVFAKAMRLNKAQQHTRELCGWTGTRTAHTFHLDVNICQDGESSKTEPAVTWPILDWRGRVITEKGRWNCLDVLARPVTVAGQRGGGQGWGRKDWRRSRRTFDVWMFRFLDVCDGFLQVRARRSRNWISRSCQSWSLRWEDELCFASQELVAGLLETLWALFEGSRRALQRSGTSFNFLLWRSGLLCEPCHRCAMCHADFDCISP